MPSHLNVPAANTTSGTASSSATLVNGAAFSSEGTAAGTFSFAELEGKDPAEQLDILNNQLVLEQRIKEGAENFLNMERLTDSLRSQVTSELEMAKNKIASITRRIEAISNTKSRQSNGALPSKRRAFHQDVRAVKDGIDKGGEDFRTALQNASTHLSSLVAFASSHPGPVPSSAATPDSVETDRQVIETMSKLTDILRRNLRVRYELKIAEVLNAVLPFLGDKYSKQARAAAYRLLRHSLIDAESVKLVDESRSLDWYIVKSLSRDNKHRVEKEQAIKLIRTMIEIGTVHRDSKSSGGAGIVPLSEPIMRALIAIAEQPEDPFRLICIETLAEILLVDIDLVSRTDGIGLLLHLLGDGPTELMPLLAVTFLHIVDSPRTRTYLRVGVDLELALSAVTDAYGKGLDHADRMKSSVKVIQTMMRTWSGLMYFCMDNMRAIRAVVDTLRIPSLDTREIILDMFFDLLNIKSPEWYQTFIDGRRLTMYQKSQDASEPKHELDAVERAHQTFNLTDQYLALLVLVFTNAGLCEALSCMLEESITGSNLTRKATLLLAEVLQMANRLLPLSVAAKIQAIPEVFEMATHYSDGEHRIVGTSAMSAIDSFNRNRARLQPSAVRTNRPRANSVEDAVRRGQRQVEQVKLKMSMQMDDKTFQSSLLETQVMLTKDHTKWNFETLQELIEGPLLNPKRMEEAIKVSRFVRRLMSFFHPFSHRFSDMPRLKTSSKWVRLGCSLLSTLMASPDGIRYLATEDQFLSQIVKSFAQLDPFNGLPDSDPIFSKKRVADTLTYGYLEMLGTLSKYKEGIELLEKFKVFTAFYHLSELRSREDLIKGIIENLSYDIDGHPRIVLSKALTSSYKHIRLYATQHLGDLIRGSATANAWTLRLLLTQLYDPAPEVCELAVHFLEEVCEDKDILQLVVEMQPTMDHLGEIGHPLLLKFMSTPMGFRYLYDAGYIDREMDMWFNERNIYYVVQVEVFLAKVFNNVTDEEDDMLAFDGTVPPHFYGEMAKTELGCQILQEKGHFTEFSQFIQKHSEESEDMELIMKLKSILWAVGNVGATEGGLPFLEEEEIIPAVLAIAEKSPVPSIRGTCFFVLGLISLTSQGAEILDDYHWEATLSPLGIPTGLCVPVDFQAFTTIPPWTPKVTDRTERLLIPPTAEAEIEVITAIQNLANTVIANTASRSLARMKSRPEYRHVFTSPTMFYRALHIISTQRYRLPIRRYVLDLFNLELNPTLVTKLKQCASVLNVHPSYRLSASDTSRLSMFGPLGRPRRTSISDEEDDLDPPTTTAVPGELPQPVTALRPVHKVVGFEEVKVQ
ncbi:putative rapamycin-insensitive companion of mTOR, domain 5 [Lyophyllum shimeji]|uniref:Rapamycin-insensitive companion of mTOR, domain 5 n=1 Tax=Lyophyllum shimeji TaxID=47721 RepID=A0A9P3UMH1_LYOSH|nr:putative rapamycin-insensitive companion of mTOR, domain 5 [Lyophyllum shimeji]